MKSLFLSLFILVSIASFGQKTISLKEFSHKDKTIQIGDTAFVKVLLQESLFASDDSLILSFGEYTWKRESLGIQHSLFRASISSLKSYPKNSDNTITVKFVLSNTNYKGYTRLFYSFKPSSEAYPDFFIQEVLSVLDERNDEVVVSYFDLFGNKIKNPVNGVFIYRTNTGETGKIFIP